MSFEKLPDEQQEKTSVEKSKGVVELGDEQLDGIAGGSKVEGICPACGANTFRFSPQHHAYLCKECGWLE